MMKQMIHKMKKHKNSHPSIWDLIKYIFAFFFKRNKAKKERFKKKKEELQKRYDEIDNKHEENADKDLENRLNNLF